MDRLSIILTLLTGSVITGTLIIALFSFSIYSWPFILMAVVIGYILAWPAAFAISRRIKANDPDWNEKKITKVEGLRPDPNKREV